MKKISMNTDEICKRYGDFRMLEICADAGFDAIDFQVAHYGTESDTENVYARGDDGIVEHFAKIKERAAELGISIGQTHGRFRIRMPDENFNKGITELSRKDLLATAALGAPYCVIHNVTSSAFPDETAGFMHKHNTEFFSAMIPYAEKYGVTFALETFGDSKRNGERILDFFGDTRELKKSYESLNTNNKAYCMDTGHTNKAVCVAREKMGIELPDVADSIRIFGSDLKALHLNDNNSYTDQHIPPMLMGDRGAVDWNGVFQALDDIGYSGTYNFELNLGKCGSYLDKYIKFLGGYLRAFVNGEF